MAASRYRLRTWLRGRSPWFVAARIPKGVHDCGDHEFYRETGGVWRCYHCEPGLALEEPYTDREKLEQERELALVYAQIDHARRDPKFQDLLRETVNRNRDALDRPGR